MAQTIAIPLLSKCTTFRSQIKNDSTQAHQNRDVRGDFFTISMLHAKKLLYPMHEEQHVCSGWIAS